MYQDVVMVTVPYGVRNKFNLFSAPAWSGLKAGDDIVVGEKVRGTVSAVCTLNIEADEYKFLLKAFNRTHPLERITGSYEYKPLFYKEEETHG